MVFTSKHLRHRSAKCWQAKGYFTNSKASSVNNDSPLLGVSRQTAPTQYFLSTCKRHSGFELFDTKTSLRLKSWIESWMQREVKS